jgi:glycosyltransferase involved in cell wall biosynthesis
LVEGRSARILILVENLSVPFDRRVRQESRALVEAGHEVVVVCPQGTTRDREPRDVVDGVEILRYPLTAATGGPAGYVREYAAALWRTWRLTRRAAGTRGFDVVHACNPPDLLFLVAWPLQRRGARFVFDHHDLVPELFLSRFYGEGTAPRLGRLLHRLAVVLERMTFHRADWVIATNESYARVAVERGRVPRARVSVVRSAPDLDRFVQVPADPALKGGREHLLCYLGVMGPQDGVDYALRAVAHLRHDMGRDDIRAVFIGSGDVFDEMVALSRTLEIDDVVHFTGRISDEDVQRHLSTADVCLAPDPFNPLNDVSTMNKIVEYMAMSRPIVSFDLREARVSAGDAAVYAPPNDEREFARLVAALLDDPERRDRMGAIGRARVEGELCWAVSRRHLIAAYDGLLAAAPRRRRRRGTAAPR